MLIALLVTPIVVKFLAAGASSRHDARRGRRAYRPDPEFQQWCIT